MAEEWAIAEVRLVHATRTEAGPDGSLVDMPFEQWEIDLDTPAGRLTHFLPVETVAWRLAEYGLDPDDPEHHALALDMALHEPHIPQPEELSPRSETVRRWTPAGTEQAVAELRAAPPAARYDPAENLRTAPSLDHARDIHLGHIARAKERIRIAAPGGEGTVAGVRRAARGSVATASAQPDPLAWILAHTAGRVDADDVARKRADVEHARRAHAERRTT